MPRPNAPTKPGVYWHDGKSWNLYDPKTAHEIREAFDNVEKEVTIGPFRGWHFVVDFRRMVQTNVESGMENRVSVVTGNELTGREPVESPGRLTRDRLSGRVSGSFKGLQRVVSRKLKRLAKGPHSYERVCPQSPETSAPSSPS